MGPVAAGELADLHRRGDHADGLRAGGRRAGAAAAASRPPVAVHVYVDTGIGRVGVPYQGPRRSFATWPGAAGVGSTA